MPPDGGSDTTTGFPPTPGGCGMPSKIWGFGDGAMRLIVWRVGCLQIWRFGENTVNGDLTSSPRHASRCGGSDTGDDCP